jgi:ABC-type transport system involved in multi-copper enzyme maturation permease subunit
MDVKFLSQTKDVASFEILKCLRRGKILGLLGWTTLILLTAYGAAILSNTLPTTPETLMKTMLSDNLFGLYTAFFVCILAGDAIAGELEHKTGFIIFTNPIKRSTILLGKFISCLVITAGILGIYYFATIVATYVLFNVFIPQVLVSYLLAILASAAEIGVVFLLSTALKGSVSSTLTSLMALALALPGVNTLLQHYRFEPWPILSYASSIIREAIQPYPGKIEEYTQLIPVGSGITQTMIVYHPDILFEIGILAIYILITLAGSAWLLNRKELS